MLINFKKAFLLAVTTSVIAVALLFIVAKAGSLTPPGLPSVPTMKTLQELYDTLAGTFDSSGQSASVNGNIIQQLKYISGMTLQQIYNNSSPASVTTVDNKDINFGLANTATDSNFKINIATGSTGSFQILNNGTPFLTATGSLLTLKKSVAGNIIELKDGTDAVVFSVDSAGNISMSGATLAFVGAGEISSGAASDLVLNAGSGQIKAAAGDAFYTEGGHPIRASGEEIYRASMPIFGYDYPARTSLASFVQISRAIVLEANSFPAAMAGTARIYKLSLRYANDAAAGDSTWRIYNITDGAPEGSSFTIPHTTTTDLSEGTVYITAAAISVPAVGKKWRVDVQPPAGGIIQVYSIELKAYDRVN